MHLDDSMILSPELPSENVSTAGDFEATNISLKKAASAKSEKLIEFLNGTEAGVKSLVFSQVRGRTALYHYATYLISALCSGRRIFNASRLLSTPPVSSRAASTDQ